MVCGESSFIYSCGGSFDMMVNCIVGCDDILLHFFLKLIEFKKKILALCGECGPSFDYSWVNHVFLGGRYFNYIVVGNCVSFFSC